MKNLKLDNLSSFFIAMKNPFSKAIPILLAIFLLISPNKILKAQLTVNTLSAMTNAVVANALTDTLMGSGVAFSNPFVRGVRSGSGYQIGYFTTATTTLAQLGFSKGVVMSTGKVTDISIALGANPQATQTATAYSDCSAGEVRKGGGCPANINDLNILAGSTYNYYDAAVLEFDFIPAGDSVKFRYVFGSEEYEDNSGIINYQCSDYNDKFGFLISGTGISGGKGYTNDARNIARLGNGSEVAINSVNNGVVGSSGGGPAAAKCTAANPAWVHNSPNAEYKGTIDGIAFNGNTKVLIASQGGLTAGQTYHIKLIVMDVNDGTYDSGVFIEAGSFSSPTAFLNTTANKPSICNGSNSYVKASVSNGTAPYVYKWSNGSSNSSANAKDSILVSPAITTTYYVTVVDSKSPTPTTATSNIVITVNNAPTVVATNNSVCAGGSASVSATGATSYTWSTASTSSSITVSPSSTLTYTVTGTNSGCTNTSQSVVTVNALPSVVSSAGTICRGATLPVTAGGANTYTWNVGGSTSSILVSPTTTTTYTVTGTDNNSCKNTSKAILTVNANPTVNAVGNTICNGASSNLTASGALVYTWNTGGTGSALNINPTTATTYTVTGSDVNGCANTAKATMAVNSLPTVNATGNTICNGGSANITAAGTATSYTWNGGSTGTTLNVNPTSTSIYTVTGKDANGCTNTSQATMTVNSKPAINATGNTICNGAVSNISASGGNTYTWSSGTTGASININPTSTTAYIVTGKDANGCTNTSQATMTVNSKPAINTTGNTICNGGSASVSAAGATSYTWNTGANGNSLSINPTTTTTYIVTGIDVNGCTNSSQVTMQVNPLPNLNAVGGTTCAGSPINVTATGANTYLWNNSSSGSIINVTPSVQTTYTVTGTTASGCTSTAFTVVAINPTISINASNRTICNGGVANVTALNGVSYTWSNSQNGSNITVTPTSTTTYTVSGLNAAGCSGTGMATVLVNSVPAVSATGNTLCTGSSANISAAGSATSFTWNTGYVGNPLVVNPTIATTYYVTGVDNNGCTNTSKASMSVNALPSVNAVGNTICVGASANIIANGSATNYTWNTGYVGSALNINPTSATIYSVTGVDVNGCTNTSQATMSVNSLPDVNASGGNTCSGAAITVTVNGATTYTWNNSTFGSSIVVSPNTQTTYSVTGTNSNGCSQSSFAVVAINPSISINTTNATICNGVSAIISAANGVSYTWDNSQNTSNISVSPISTTNYSVTGVNSSGCSGTGIASVMVNQNPIISASNNTICNGGNINVSVSGNASSYTWDTGIIGTSINVNPIIASSYMVTGVDLNGCTNTSQANVAVNAKPNINTTAGNTCAGSPINVTAVGASKYTWDNSTIGSVLVVSPVIQTSYYVTGANSNGCTNSSIAVVSINPTITINTFSSTICNGQLATISALNGVAYTWSNSQNGSSISIAPVSTSNYSVTGSNAAGCTGVGLASVFVNQLPNVTATGNSLCIGSSANLLAGGSATTYTWGDGTVGNTLIVNPTTATNYNVTGTDNNGCTNSAQATMLVSSLPTISATGGAICPGGNTNISASGGNIYTWDNSSVNSYINVSPAIATTYSVTGTDANGCTNIAQATVTINSVPSINATSSPICVGDNATVNVSGSSSTYTWFNGLNTNFITVNPTSSTAYSVTGTDNNGCTNSAKTTVNVNGLPSVNASSSAICIGDNATVTASGSAVTYTWFNGLNTISINVNPNSPTSYSVTGTDINGCTNTALGTVNVNSLPNVSASGKTICIGDNATITALGSATTYTWFNGSNSNSISVSPNTLTSYMVTGTDANGCTNTALASVGVNLLPNVLATDNTVCSGKVTNISASGTATTYTWNTGEQGASLNVNPKIITNYTVTGTDANGCTNIATSTVYISQSADGNALVDSVYATISHNFIFNWNGIQNCTYNWNFGDSSTNSTIQNPNHLYTTPGKYLIKVVVTSPGGCDSIYYLNVEVYEISQLIIPNIVTPNGDGYNDLFKVSYKGSFPVFNMMIFNRWGEKLFENKDIDKGWDPKSHADGTYFYIIQATGSDKKPYDKHGYIQVVR